MEVLFVHVPIKELPMGRVNTWRSNLKARNIDSSVIDQLEMSSIADLVVLSSMNELPEELNRNILAEEADDALYLFLNLMEVSLRNMFMKEVEALGWQEVKAP